MKVETKCRDFGRGGCLGEPDESYTMDFTMIGQGYLYWCSACGPKAKALDDAIITAAQADPTFAERALNALAQVEAIGCNSPGCPCNKNRN